MRVLPSGAVISDEVTKNPIPIFAITANYEELKNFPSEATPFDTSLQESVLEYLNKLRFIINGLRNDVEYILANKYQFEDFKEKTLINAVNKSNDNLNRINLLAKQCLANFSSCQYPTNLEIEETPIPQRVLKAEADNQCKLRSNYLCGEIYYEKVSPACDVNMYQIKRDPLCGVEQYQMQRSDNCEVESYKYSSGKICGAASFNEGKNGDICGWEELPCEKSLSEFAKEPIGRCPTRRAAKTCRSPQFGVQSYLSCRHTSFGIELRKECRHSTHPVEIYKECQHASFGVKEHNACRHIAHGVEGVKSCLLKEIYDPNTRIVKFEACH